MKNNKSAINKKLSRSFDSIKNVEKLMKLMSPINGHVNPLWLIISPIATYIIVKTEFFKSRAEPYKEIFKNMGISKMKLYRDISYSTISMGASVVDYMNFYDMKLKYREQYMTVVKHCSTVMKVNDMKKSEKLDDKELAANSLSKWMKRDFITLKTENDIQNCIEFLNKYKTCFIKPINGMEGIGVHRITAEKIENPAEFFSDKLKETTWILEEEIIQHPILSELCPNVVATIRLHTLRSKKGEVKILWPYIRMGRLGDDAVRYFDISANIDCDSGSTFGYVIGYDEEIRVCHPDTGAKVIGLELPEWNEAKKMALELAHVFPEFRFVGWDLAYSKDKGWVVIEANACPTFPSYERILNRGMYDDFCEMIKWANEN